MKCVSAAGHATLLVPNRVTGRQLALTVCIIYCSESTLMQMFEGAPDANMQSE